MADQRKWSDGYAEASLSDPPFENPHNRRTPLARRLFEMALRVDAYPVYAFARASETVSHAEQVSFLLGAIEQLAMQNKRLTDEISRFVACGLPPIYLVSNDSSLHPTKESL